MFALRILLALLFSSLWVLSCSAQEDAEPSLTQPVSDQLLPTSRLIQPAGDSIHFNGRPVDLAIHEQWLLVKDRNALRVIDIETFKLVQTIPSPGGASLHGMTVGKSGRVYFTNSGRGLHIYEPSADAKPDKPYQFLKTVNLPSASFPCGVHVNDDETQAVVCLSKKNSLGVVDLEGSEQETVQIDVGVAPFDLIQDLSNPSRFWVSSIGGRRPVEGDLTAPSAKTETVVDKRGIAETGLVSLIDVARPQQKPVQEIAAGRHPTTFANAAGQVFVCNTNDDTVTRIDSATFETKAFSVKPDEQLPFGSMPSDIHLLADGTQLIALSGNNAVAVRSAKTQLGLIPTGWYPVALASNDDYLFVANIKGSGSRATVRAAEKGRNSHDHFGSVQRIRIADIRDSKTLAKWTESVTENSRFPQILRSMDLDTSVNEAKPVPIPEKLGQPSVFKHVIYVIKENRTFDQVFGDLKDEGVRAEPKLCVFPEAITPNHHALAKRFGVLDNYYCNGVLSADGHSWATEANVTPYLERAFGGFARSYTFGDDPITYSSSGFIWDKFLDAGLSFRNFGEMDYAKPPKGMKYQEIWKAYSEGKPIEFNQNVGIDRLRKYTSRDYPGWNMVIPDVLRMDQFLKEFQQFEQNDGLPNLCIVYLPQDHLGGGVTSRAHMADNDQAIGRLVEAVSASQYWKDTAIFINEDDPQNGYDHIDGHRSLCLAISAYSKPGVNHQFYNQSSVIRTMLHIFGLPPMNQQDASAPLMRNCFQAAADLTPYKNLATEIPLNETSLPKDQQGSVERQWRARLATVPIERTGMKTEADEETLNRFIWHEMKGWDTPYPAEWAGPHGRGLTELGLTLTKE